ncbi:MAG: pyridoxal phosphate-dependent aminotransferase, partial [Limisphaerales bacterium]
VRRLRPYAYGEQPRIKGLIKLNTNENPYPPSPGVLKALKSAVDGRLRLYPNPTAQPLREKLAKYHQCAPENIIVGNGSDELLALAVRCFVEPVSGRCSHGHREAKSKSAQTTVQYFTPSYSLYPVLADIHGAEKNPARLMPDFKFPDIEAPKSPWKFDAALTFITTPNAPGGRGYTTRELERLCRRQEGVIILDEAYVDFADAHAMELARQFSHVLVARTFSKAYSLCFQRVGYLAGNAELIGALHKIRDSYNVNGLGQVAAEATLDDLGYYRANFERIIATREWFSRELAALGFRVFPSQTNFIFTGPPRFTAQQWLKKLRERRILVRWFAAPDIAHFLRISIGTRGEMEQLLETAKSILRGTSRRSVRRG